MAQWFQPRWQRQPMGGLSSDHLIELIDIFFWIEGANLGCLFTLKGSI